MIDLDPDDLIQEIFDQSGEDPELVLHALRLLSNPAALQEARKRTHTPVGIEQFVEDPFFLNKKGTVWPEVMQELKAMNGGGYLEVVLTGGIGCAKSTAALYSTAFQLYLLSTLHDPHSEYGLDPSSEILIVFQSLNASTAKDLDYARFRHMIGGSPYFLKHFPFERGIESEMRFPRRIIVRPISGQETGAIGQNVIGGLLDEVNFGSVVENSKQNRDGGAYDQMMSNYQSLARRRESRFLNKGTMPGLICLASSARYPGQFTDIKVAERDRQLEQHGRTSIYVYDKRSWEVSPAGRFGPERFNVFVGSPSRKPEIVADLGAYSEDERRLIIEVPEEYRAQFENDIYNAIRDIAGRPTQALFPFLPDSNAVAEAFGKTVSVLSREDCDFVQTTVQVFPKRIHMPDEPRFAHVDLSLTGDSTGVAVGYIKGFTDLARGTWTETLPLIAYDLILEVKPPKGKEIEYSRIRGLLYKLRELGMNLKWISFDSFQSVDSQQIMAGQGFITGRQSMDTDSLAYDMLKTAFYDRRILAPEHPKALRELVRLERDPKTGRVDHTAHESKDLSDAMAGVCYGLTRRRELWMRHSVPVSKIPTHLFKKAEAASPND